MIKTLSQFVLLPFFILLMIYLFSRMSGIYIFDEGLWKLVLTTPFLAGYIKILIDYES